MPRKPKLAPHLRIRLDADLLARVEKSRQANHRTLTGEISARLEESFRREDRRQLIEDTTKTTLSILGAEMSRDDLVALAKGTITRDRGPAKEE
jgi:Mg/Co/Ni transporter MgtE